MTQLLKPVQKNNRIFLLEKISLYLVTLAALLCAYLYGEYDGFVKGGNAVRDILREGLPKYSFSGSGRPAYELISEDYFFVLIVLLIILSVHLFVNGIASKLINLFLLCFVIKGCFTIFRFKGGLFDVENFESQYFDIVRQTVSFDIAGAIIIGSLLIIQIILVILALRKERAINFVNTIE